MRAEMIYIVIATMLLAFVMSIILSYVVMSKGHNYTAALITIAYLIGCLGVVIYALA